MRFSQLLLLFLGVLPVQRPPQSTGVKMTVRDTLSPRFTTEQTTYFQADRKRIEWRSSDGPRLGPHIATITRCDLGKTFMLNLDTREYDSAPYPPEAFAQALAKMKALKAQARPVSPLQSRKATLRIETTTVDTGERKQMFGRTARHMTITQKYIPLPGSKQMARESVTEAWYIDLDVQLSCDFKFPPGARVQYVALSGSPEQQEVPEFVTVGEAAKGFPMAQTMRNTSTLELPDGRMKQFTSQSELAVIDFEDGPLDPSLFEIPATFKLVDHVDPNPPPQVPSAWERFKARFANLFRD